MVKIEMPFLIRKHTEIRRTIMEENDRRNEDPIRKAERLAAWAETEADWQAHKAKVMDNLFPSRGDTQA